MMHVSNMCEAGQHEKCAQCVCDCHPPSAAYQDEEEPAPLVNQTPFLLHSGDCQELPESMRPPQCEATFNGDRCERPSGHTRKHIGLDKWWENTDAPAEAPPKLCGVRCDYAKEWTCELTEGHEGAHRNRIYDFVNAPPVGACKSQYAIFPGIFCDYAAGHEGLHSNTKQHVEWVSAPPHITNLHESMAQVFTKAEVDEILSSVTEGVKSCASSGAKFKQEVRSYVVPDARAQMLVQEFCSTFGHSMQCLPSVPPEQISQLWMRLIREESNELRDALAVQDIVGVADGIADLLYVVLGLACAAGINIAPVFNEVHRSNMTKLGEDGKPILREDGKILKGPNYERPDIEGVLAAQGA